MAPRWTRHAQRDRVPELAAQGLHASAIARELLVSVATLCDWARADGVALPVFSRGVPGRTIQQTQPPKKRRHGFDLTGRTFGDLRVLRREGSVLWGKSSRPLWRCECSCGKSLVVEAGRLIGAPHKQKRSCGHERTGLKQAQPREYLLWLRIRRRGPVCEQWNLFEQFFADIGPRPADSTYFVRLSDQRPYEPGNCAFLGGLRSSAIFELHGERRALRDWADQVGLKYGTVWGRHKRGLPLARALSLSAEPVQYEFRGTRHSLREWAKAVGLKYATVWNRLKLGWSLERALELPAGPSLVEHNGEAKTFREWAEAAGLNPGTVYARLREGWSLGRALGTPAERKNLEAGLRAAERELGKRRG